MSLDEQKEKYEEKKAQASEKLNEQKEKYEEKKAQASDKLNEQIENLSVKLDEQKVKYEEKKAQAKINHEERKIELKAKYTDKKISAHIEKALRIVYKAEDDADKDIIKLLNAIESEIEADEKPIEFILFKAENKFEEIILTAEVKMQKAKNGLIKNLEKDMKNVSELVTLEENLSTFKDEMDEVSSLLDERVEIEKETLTLKA